MAAQLSCSADVLFSDFGGAHSRFVTLRLVQHFDRISVVVFCCLISSAFANLMNFNRVQLNLI